MQISHPKKHSGAALVTLLALLVLLTVLIVAFFAATQMETRSSSDNAHLSELQRLRKLPLEIVKEQIRAATTFGQTNTLSDVTHTWASQPGLIRVFSTSNANSLDRLYKLYSSDRMEETNAAFLATEIPGTWPTQTNRYVNLNRPFPSPTNAAQLTWPILDPQAVNWAEGLTIAADPAGQTNAPMPVEWLYVLKDGSLVPQSALTNAANPPTARIAFWTDDETCKVNLNTAGERAFWDRPRAGHHRCADFLYKQPSTGEYNAYPGHPATVSLSAVFGKSLVGLSHKDLVKTMLELTPRYAWGGSQDGTIPTYSPRTELDRTKPGSTIKNDRLFASASEIFYTPNRAISNASLEDALKRSGFLLTTSSRAPELNLFGLPRVGLWPLDVSPANRTIYDDLIARGTTIGSHPFYFQRSNPFAMNEATGIPRNWSLLEYLDSLTSRNIPGFGGSFSGKYGAQGNQQILTEMFDYIRSLTNLCDTSRGEAEFSKQFTPATSPTRGYVLPTRIPAWKTRGFGRLPVVTNVGVVLYAYQQRGYTAQNQANLDSLTNEEMDEVETDVHMLLWFNFITPSLGVAPLSTTYKIVVKNQPGWGLSNTDGTGVQAFTLRNLTSNRFKFTDQGKDWGGYETMMGQGSGEQALNRPPLFEYEFHSQAPITITGPNMNFIGGTLEFEIYDLSTDQLLQTYTLEFPSSSSPWPIPLAWQKSNRNQSGMPWPGHDDRFQSLECYFWQRDPTNPKFRDSDEVDEVITPNGPVEKTNINAYTFVTRRQKDPRQLDVVRGVELKHGDARIVSCLDTIPSTMFQPSTSYDDSNRRVACSLLFARNVSNIVRVLGSEFGKFADTIFHDEGRPVSFLALNNRPPLPAEFDTGSSRIPFTSLRNLNWCGDIDAGMLGEPDGPFLNKPDEGFISTQDPAIVGWGTQVPYYRSMQVNIHGEFIRSWDPRAEGFFSPTRQMPSAIQFGSLPANVLGNEPWRTLLFCPNSQAAMVASGNGSLGHPGAESPPDYLYLDLFTMPTVEPYAISEPFSTAGKINLNQRLIPFGHIKRETALRAVLKNMALIATENNVPQISAWYKEPNTAPSRWHLLRDLDVDRTIVEIGKILDPSGSTGAGAFRSPAEICDVFFIPNDQGADPMAYWNTHQLAADNSREAPYNYVYPLLTTQSNTYQVHYLAQTLAPLVNKSGFNPAVDFKVTGEMQGSYLLERYLDINDPVFQGGSGAVDPMQTPLNEYYKFRVLRHSAFTPDS